MCRRPLYAFIALFSHYRERDGAHLHAQQANMHHHRRETDASVKMIEAQSRMAKRIHLRFEALRTRKRPQKAPMETTLKGCNLNLSKIDLKS
jgi:hypothetical protein